MTDSTESRERDGVQQPVEALGHHTGHRTEQEQELQQQTEVQKVQQQQQQQQETLHQFSPNSKTRSAEIMDREMKITDSIDTRGLLESSVRLKPHEAQSYRKKALWVSWTSILVTIVLAIAAFSQ